MTQSLVLRWVLTVVFAGLGGYCLVRCAPPVSAHADHRRAALISDLAHVAMSTAMIAMLWAPAPDDRWGIQMTVFAVAALWYLARAVASGGGRRYRVGVLHQGFAMAAMFWMFLTMSGLLDTSAPDMPGMAMSGTAMSGMDMPGMGGSSGQPAAVRLVTVALAGYLALAAVWWARTGVGLISSGSGPGTTGTVGVGGGGARMLRTVFGPTGEACCQTLMSAGMCVSLLILM